MRYVLILLTFPLSFLIAENGINYSYFEEPSCMSCQSIHIIEIDPDKSNIKPIKAIDNGIGRESVLSIANRYNAVAAINGGFFKIDGRASGALKIDDWYGLPIKLRGCIGWSSKNNSAVFDQLLVSIIGKHGSSPFSIDGLNRPRKDCEMILFNSMFNRTTLTCPDGEEIIIKDGSIIDIRKNKGSSIIPNDGYVLSIQKNHPLFNYFQMGDSLSFDFNLKPQNTSPKEWKNCDYIIGGAPLLIFDKMKITDFSLEKTIPTFLTKRYARTAIGILENGYWVFVVVDKTDFCSGMTMAELTEFMHSIGCIYALNLDGGGSSTLVYEKEIKNTPHGDEEEGAGKKIVRRVSDAIIVVPKSINK